MPRRADPCIPPPTSAGAWQCPPCLASVPSVPLCPPHLGTSCGEWPARPSRPPAPPHGACLPPAPSPPLPGARSQPSSIEGQQPPGPAPPVPAPAHLAGCGRRSGPAALGPGSARTWGRVPAPGTKAASTAWPSPWPRTSNLPRRALVREAAGLGLESRGGKSSRD